MKVELKFASIKFFGEAGVAISKSHSSSLRFYNFFPFNISFGKAYSYNESLIESSTKNYRPESGSSYSIRDDLLLDVLFGSRSLTFNLTSIFSFG